jgi:hypothetical protein
LNMAQILSGEKIWDSREELRYTIPASVFLWGHIGHWSQGLEQEAPLSVSVKDQTFQAL